MYKTASIMSLLTLIVSLVVLGLVSTGCGGGGSSNATLTGTLINPSGSADAGYTVTAKSGTSTIGTGTASSAGVFSITAVPGAVLGTTVTLYFTDASGNAVGSVTETVNPASVVGNTINFGTITAGLPVSG
jgi:hypothetical protein